MSNQEQMQKPGNFRAKMILLAIIFLLPLGYAVYLKATGWHPDKTTNYGELVIPAVPLEDVAMQTINGKPVSLKDFSHHWLMVTFSGSACDAACEQNIYKMRQTHIAQGKYQLRVKRLLKDHFHAKMDTHGYRGQGSDMKQGQGHEQHLSDFPEGGF